MAVSSAMFSQIANLKNVVKPGNRAANLLMRIPNSSNSICLYSMKSTAPATDAPAKPQSQKKMSKAMLNYLERAKAYDNFIKKEKEDYQIGKRHLANMMGEDPNVFSQTDVNKAITYLFPSGLYEKLARPVMKPPEEIFPPRKAAAFDETGRPFHSMFYTTRPNYYQALYDIVEAMENLDKFEDSMIRKGVAPKPENQIALESSDWLTKIQLEKLLLEDINDHEYEYFISTLKRLIDHPYARQAEETVIKFRKPRILVTDTLKALEIEYDENGRPIVHVPRCIRKSARASVTVKGGGSGIITINGQSMINYFPKAQDREQVRNLIIFYKKKKKKKKKRSEVSNNFNVTFEFASSCIFNVTKKK